MAKSRPPTHRFLPPPADPPERHRDSSGARDVFAEGQWPSIRASLERQGWSTSQIERLHDHLRQGWPLAVAKQNVAALTRQCPLRSRSHEA
ncbi:MAG: hypothetical protein ACK5QW_08730 [Cyanobacteriota bacterium]